MATYRKNKAEKWEVQIARKPRGGGETVRRSGTFETKREAERWAAKVESEIMGGKKAAVDKTFGDLLTRYLTEVVPSKGAPEIEERRIQKMLKDDICKIKLRDLGATHISKWRDARSREVAPATVVRDMSTMSAAVRMAVKEWEWLENNPFSSVKWPKPPPGRDRRITQDEIDRILLAAGYQYDEKPESVRARTGAAFLFAIETAMRDGEIATLTMDNVHIEKKYVHLRTRDADGYNKRNVPLSPEAIRIIKQMNVSEGLLFGLSAQQISATFQRLKLTCGLDDLRFHDARHEAVTRLASKLQILDLARMTGHKNLKQLMVYYNKSASEIAEGL